MKYFQVYKEQGAYKHIIECVEGDDSQETLVCDKELSAELSMNEVIQEGVDFIREYFHPDYCFAVNKSNQKMVQ